MINQEKIQVKNGSTWNKICPFPVGYVYLSSTNTSPASIYGGTWTQITGEWYLRAGTNFSQGGSNYISIQQMPKHTHSVLHPLTSLWQIVDSPAGGLNYVTDGNTEYDPTIKQTGSTGGGQPYYPPYQNVYVWYRKA